MKVNFKNHLCHPFSQENLRLKKSQKLMAAAGLLLTVPFIFPGLITFYGLAYFFKAKQLKAIELGGTTAKKVSKTGLGSLSGSDSEIFNDALSSSASSTDDNDPSRSIQEKAFSDALPSSKSVSDSLHPQDEIQELISTLRANDEAEANEIVERFKKQISDWSAYLVDLSKNRKEEFGNLLEILLKNHKSDRWKDFIKILDLDQLQKLCDLLLPFTITFGDSNKTLFLPKSLLPRLSDYFRGLIEFNSTIHELDLPEGHFDILPSLINFYLFDKDLQISDKNLDDVLDAASSYEFKTIEAECQRWMLENLNLYDADSLFQIADKYHLELVKSQIVQQYLGNPAQLDENLLKQWLPKLTTLEIRKDLGKKLKWILSLCHQLQKLEAHVYHKEALDHLQAAQMPQLAKVTLTFKNHFFAPQDLRLLKNLPILSLNFTGVKCITDTHLSYLKMFPQLKCLYLNGCEAITDKGLEKIKAITTIKYLDLGCTAITDEGLAHLRDLTGLVSLDLFFCEGITDKGLSSLGHLIRLKRLNFSYCSQIKGEGLGILKKLQDLIYFNLTDCSNMQSKDWLVHLVSLKKLEFLGLPSDIQIKDQDLAYLENLKHLQAINLNDTGITDRGLSHLKDLTELEYLNLARCRGVTNQGLHYLEHLTKLQVLDLSSCPKINQNSALQLQQKAGIRNIELHDMGRCTALYFSQKATKNKLWRI